MSVNERLIALLQQELLPALGCTEPTAVAYAGAYAVKLLACPPESMVVEASSNIIKNVKSVTVPNSKGMKGIEAAAALGAFGGDADLKLEVLCVVDDEGIDKARAFVAAGGCQVQRLASEHTLDLIVRAKAQGHEALVHLRDKHTNVISACLDGVETLAPADALDESKGDEGSVFDGINLQDIFDFATKADLSPVAELLDTQIKYNSAISQEGLKTGQGAGIGSLNYPTVEDPMLLDLIVMQKAAAAAAAGSDARMNGCDLPVVINSGSGNQGLSVSMPVIIFAESYQKSHEELIRALCLANLVSLYQKSYIGRLSAFCGAVSASTAAAAGVTYLMGGGYDEVARTIINSLATLSGMVCDGAKASCAAKVCTAVSCALQSYRLSKSGFAFSCGDGLVKEDVDATIRAIGQMAKEGMARTDEEIVEIMLRK